MEKEWKPDESLRRIVCAACLYCLGKHQPNILILGSRHWDNIMRSHHGLLDMAFRNAPEQSKFEEGFIDNFGTFWNRKDALVIARRMNQVIRELNYKTEELYSEMLY